MLHGPRSGSPHLEQQTINHQSRPVIEGLFDCCYHYLLVSNQITFNILKQASIGFPPPQYIAWALAPIWAARLHTVNERRRQTNILLDPRTIWKSNRFFGFNKPTQISIHIADNTSITLCGCVMNGLCPEKTLSIFNVGILEIISSWKGRGIAWSSSQTRNVCGIPQFDGMQSTGVSNASWDCLSTSLKYLSASSPGTPLKKASFAVGWTNDEAF